MSEARHTPGPWYSHGGRTVRAEDGLPVAEAACCEMADTIDGQEHRDFMEESQRLHPEAAANARLISSAPAMYEALEDLLG